MNLILGVEIGGTKLQLAIGTIDGELLEIYQGKVEVEKGAPGILDWIQENVPLMVEKVKQYDGHIIGIGVGFGGPVETKTGRILKSVQISGWDGFKLKNWFEENFNLPAVVANDTNAAGWGEYCRGTGQGSRQFFYTNIGSGIGGALIVDGKLYDGQGFGAGEFGQTNVPDWRSNESGAIETVENLCSGWAIEERLHLMTIPENSLLMELCNGKQQNITCKMLGEAANKGDQFSLEEIERITHTFGIALSNLINLFSPEVIAIGGGVSNLGELLFSRIRKYTHKYEFITNHNRYEIKKCQLGDSIVLVGAILLASEKLKGED